jgi:hypothetical protein
MPARRTALAAALATLLALMAPSPVAQAEPEPIGGTVYQIAVDGDEPGVITQVALDDGRVLALDEAEAAGFTTGDRVSATVAGGAAMGVTSLGEAVATGPVTLKHNFEVVVAYNKAASGWLSTDQVAEYIGWMEQYFTAQTGYAFDFGATYDKATAKWRLDSSRVKVKWLKDTANVCGGQNQTLALWNLAALAFGHANRLWYNRTGGSSTPTHLIVFENRTVDCAVSPSYWGLGDIGGWALATGNGGSVMVRIQASQPFEYDHESLAHEIGHNFSLRHSDLIACKSGSGWDESKQGNCLGYGYGDWWELMGGGRDDR